MSYVRRVAIESRKPRSKMKTGEQECPVSPAPLRPLWKETEIGVLFDISLEPLAVGTFMFCYSCL
jgi:hypothetical protein